MSPRPRTRLALALLAVLALALVTASAAQAAETPWGELERFGEKGTAEGQLEAPEYAFGIDQSDGGLWVADTVSEGVTATARLVAATLADDEIDDHGNHHEPKHQRDEALVHGAPRHAHEVKGDWLRTGSNGASRSGAGPGRAGVSGGGRIGGHCCGG